MAIQMHLLGGQASSQITAQTVVLNDVAVGSSSVSVTFNSAGTQFTTVNGSTAALGAWVVPSSQAANWEIRAVLESGDAPTTGTLNTWEGLSTSRTWGLSRSSIGQSEASLLFEFRRVGATDAEVSFPTNTLSVEVLDIFS
jgi:hypothetical protein